MKPRKKSPSAPETTDDPSEVDLDAEASFRKLAARVPVAIFVTNTQGVPLFVNEHWCELTGLTLAETQGEGRRRVLHPDDAERVSLAWATALEGGVPFDGEYRLLRRDGRVVWVAGKARPLLNDQGQAVGLIGTLSDITQRRQSEQDTRAAQAMLKATLDASTLAVIGLDLETSMTLVNRGAERMLGYRADELLGKHPEHVFFDPEELRAQVRAEAERMGRDVDSSLRILRERVFAQVDAGQPFDSVMSFLRKDGSPLPVQVVLTAIRDGDQRLLGRLMVVRDLTAQQKAEEEMRRAREEAEASSRAKSEFLANISHEVRTPLNGILGMIELLLGEAPQGTLLERLHVIQDSAESLLRIVNDVLDFSKIEAGKFVLDPAPFDLRAEVQRVTRAMHHRAQEKGLRLVCQLDASLPASLVGDAGRLRQVLVNLLGNAIKFTSSGAVVLRVQSEGARSDAVAVRFEVIDTGIGIPADKQEAIFRPFEQVDTSTTRKAGGTGLGLPIGARLVALMGGQLSVQSTPGEGSTFSFSLHLPAPAVSMTSPFALPAPPPSDPAAQAAPAPEAPRGDPLRVLVVEDNAVNRLVAVAMLERGGHRVWVAASGPEALSALTNERFDVVLMDVQMPGMDGLQTTAAIRELEAKLGRRTPIVALTAHAMAGHERACRDAGMDGFLTKPIRAESLEATLRSVCSPPALVPAAALWTRFGGDAGLLAGAAALLRAELPSSMERLRSAITRGDGAALASTAHRMVGSVGVFEATALVDALRRVEALGRSGELTSAAPAVEALASLFAQLDRELGSLTAPA